MSFPLHIFLFFRMVRAFVCVPACVIVCACVCAYKRNYCLTEWYASKRQMSVICVSTRPAYLFTAKWRGDNSFSSRPSTSCNSSMKYMKPFPISMAFSRSMLNSSRANLPWRLKEIKVCVSYVRSIFIMQNIKLGKVGLYFITRDLSKSYTYECMNQHNVWYLCCHKYL